MEDILEGVSNAVGGSRGEAAVDEHHGAGVELVLLGEGGLHDTEGEHGTGRGDGGDGEEGVGRRVDGQRPGDDVHEDGDGSEDLFETAFSPLERC